MASKRQNSTLTDRPSKRVKSATSSKKTNAKVGNKKTSLPRKPVRLDRLRWKEVALPDRLDDVEGFMGLEVIDDVEVVRKDDGLIEFRALEDAIEDEAVANGDVGGEDYEEWGGFGDEEQKSNETNDVGDHVETEQAPVKEKKQKQKKKAKEPKANSTQSLKTNGDTLSNPFVALPDGNIEEDVPNLPDWEPLTLSDATIRALSKLSFTSPTKIQSAAIAHIISGHDVIGKASTGSGKTLAFGIPIFEHWLSAQSQPPSSKIALDGEEDDTAASRGIKNTSEAASFNHPLTALIISPTRELAHQITSHITDLTNNSGLPSPPRTVSLTGGLSLQKQCRQLTQFGGADIVVATPGRLWEVLSSGKGFVEWFRRVRFLVVDEADRVLQDGHFKEVEDVVDLLVREDEEGIDGVENGGGNNEKNKHAKHRQTLVFSATFSRELQQKLAKHSVRGHRNGNKSAASADGLMGGKETMEYLLQKLPFREDHPQMIDVNPVAQMAENLREGVVECGNMEKDLYLYFLLLRFPLRTLVFTNSISTVKRLSTFLSNLKLPAYPLHSSMIQKARLRSLERFASAANATKDGKDTKTQQQQPSVLISTDVAARGLDIKGVEMVVHYHVPRTADAYVHRSGRTARAEHRGVSVLLCSPDEAAEVRRLVARVHVQHSASPSSSSSSVTRELKTIPVDRTLVKRLKLRVELAQKITSSTLVQSAQRSESNWMKEAAEELGVDYDSDEFAAMGRKGKGAQRGKEKRRKAGAVTKDELAGMRAQLNEELKSQVGGGSRLYLTAGKDGENLAQRLIEGRGHDVFFGEEGGWGLKELLEA